MSALGVLADRKQVPVICDHKSKQFEAGWLLPPTAFSQLMEMDIGFIGR